jgi:hypothetical protein
MGGEEVRIERIRPEPRITANKLGEYMDASAARRERIIADQKRPKVYRGVRYEEAQEVITEFLVGGAKDTMYVLREIEELRNAVAETEWESPNNRLCAVALESFLDLRDDLALDGLELSRGDSQPSKLRIGGVEVSVRPEVVVSRTDRRGETITGAIKLYFPKSYPLTDKAGEYVATMVRQFMVEHQPIPGKVHHTLCRVVDVSQGRVFTAPLCYRRRHVDLEAACREIYRAWEDQ